MDAEGLSLDDKESLKLQNDLVEQMGASGIAELVSTYGQDYVNESVGLLRVEDFIVKNASVSEKIAYGDAIGVDAEAAVKNAEQDTEDTENADLAADEADTSDSNSDDSDIDENLEDELGTEEVE